MKKITIFIQKRCPYCQAALSALETLLVKETYQDIEIALIDELEEPGLAESFDYYYVPTFYYQDKKLHEGAISAQKVQQLLDGVLNDA